MARIGRKTRLAGLIAVVVIVVVAAGYLARQHFGGGRTAGAADSTAIADSTGKGGGDTAGAADSQENKKKKDRKGKKGQEEKEAPPVPIEVAQAGLRSISSYYVTTATLEPERKVDILAKISGQVREINVEEGDVVEAGALLCRLDDDEPRIALEEAKINRQQREQDFKRVESMFQQNLISEKEYLDVKYQHELAVNAYESAELRYGYTRIQAPFKGVVTERLVDVGKTVNVGSQLFVMADTEPLELTMYLPEGEIKSIRRGQDVFINPDANPDARFTGRIIRIAPEVDQRTGTVKVTAETRGTGIPGSFVRVRIVTDTKLSTLAVPRRGLVADAGDRYLFVAAADTVRKVPVTVGYEDEDYAEILEGIQSGDSVVVAGTGGIRSGTRIKIVAPPEDSVTAAAKK